MGLKKPKIEAGVEPVKIYNTSGVSGVGEKSIGGDIFTHVYYDSDSSIDIGTNSTSGEVLLEVDLREYSKIVLALPIVTNSNISKFNDVAAPSYGGYDNYFYTNLAIGEPLVITYKQGDTTTVEFYLNSNGYPTIKTADSRGTNYVWTTIWHFAIYAEK